MSIGEHEEIEEARDWEVEDQVIKGGSQKVERAQRKWKFKRAKGKPKVRRISIRKQRISFMSGCWQTRRKGQAVGPEGQKRVEGPPRQEEAEGPVGQQEADGQETLLIVLPCERLRPVMN